MSVTDSTPRVRLTVLQPQLPAAHISFEPQTITLGRAEDCTIPIRDRFLSRHHAEIVWAEEKWFIRDRGSVNGTLLNGERISQSMPLSPGDRIGLGDTQVLVEGHDPGSQLLSVVGDSSHRTNLAIPLDKAIEDDATNRGPERARILNQLALQFIEDRPMNDLFDFILDRVHDLLSPARASLALFGPDHATFANVKVRHANAGASPAELKISRTLLSQVVGERKIVSFVENDIEDKFARAESIVAQQIGAAVCAPLLVGDQVLGVLYLDFITTHRRVIEADLRLIAQIARFAAAKLETTRLREESMAKAKLDEELRTAYAIQSRLLPNELPEINGYTFAGGNRPCKTVSGDYYDVIVRPDGRIYFVVADVSGKGITAALIMFAMATAFNIFTRTDPTPAELARQINQTLAPKTAPSKFATVFFGVLDPATGVVEFTNAGHVPPLVVCCDGVRELKTTDIVVGLFPQAVYRNQSVTLQPGDSLIMFTDGITEAENEAEAQLGIEPVLGLLGSRHASTAKALIEAIDAEVERFACGVPPGDDVTMLVISRGGIAAS